MVSYCQNKIFKCAAFIVQ